MPHIPLKDVISVIVRRYLTKEVFQSMLSILAVLLIVMVANSFVHYLSQAAEGSMSFLAVSKIIALMLPRLVAFILPISLFLAILFVYGKLFANSELLVMMACGLSWRRLFLITLGPTAVVVIITAVIMIWVQPLMRFYQNSIHNSANKQSVSLIQSGQFLGLNHGRQIVYIGGHSKDNKTVKDVFIYIKPKTGRVVKVVKAPSGEQIKDPSTGHDFMRLDNGTQYELHPGQKDVSITHFGSYAIRIQGSGVTASDRGTKSQPTRQLFHEHSRAALTELQWRFSIPIATIILAMLGVGLSYVQPRQGRFGKILPAILVFIIYFNILTASRSWLENGTIPEFLGLWWVHAMFGVIAVLILWHRDGRKWGRSLA